TTMTILFRPQGAFGWFSYTTSRDTISHRYQAFQDQANDLGLALPHANRIYVLRGHCRGLGSM
ncbi:hypothetical protein, partial [Pseudomonas aeruginosa]|uniref:hypothetical protein n=1 Tax=Pseudomonas aeruginosa TaxID=287 RepID=UPI003F6DE803